MLELSSKAYVQIKRPFESTLEVEVLMALFFCLKPAPMYQSNMIFSDGRLW